MILDKIVASTYLRIENSKKNISLQQMKTKSSKSKIPFGFENCLKNEEIAFICEIKKASPSKGIISSDFNYLEIATQYEKSGANAISVLTEPEFFLGENKFLQEIKQIVSIPVIRKDFILDEYQIYESSFLKADAILLICSILNNEQIINFIKLSDELGISCLVETHNKEEIERAIKCGARIIGVNNRNLNTFEVDINNSLNLRKHVPENILFVSESGISSKEQIDILKSNKVNAVLIGETLMKSIDKNCMLENLRGF